MGFTRYSRCITAWLALVALALNSAWPLVAKAAPRDPGLSDICTVAGLQPSANGAGHAGTHESPAPHCTYCSHAGAKAVFTSHATLPAVRFERRCALAVVDVQFPPDSPHMFAAPRAPPSHS